MGIMQQIMQQLIGINVLMYYAPKVFQAADFGASAAGWKNVHTSIFLKQNSEAGRQKNGFRNEPEAIFYLR
ncbi:hypothetical protein CFR77_11760 [Komagataeibacter sucrofermentans]|uniref:Uncharacterized protein n=1 Tax=Komagataeibacter sucrofermentans TaxID=1053551 RepID=A0A318QLC9_9PROT|nr:hypothetical protein CFR77_11760 [Komagataeibacter sucrofermentans]